MAESDETGDAGSAGPLTLNDVPILEDWINVTEAAERLGISRQYAFRQIQSGKWKSVHRLGSKKFYVVRESEVAEKLAAKGKPS